ncbi:uncharacterized protein LOC113492475 [Trichoplusia ni]|uniref:Uncharacterized protein LOC113492475 n=1 Tax=Trichoplusia ni TaxID=7111 RepID=A0A7E5VBR9_TRINI|nr:uncharacterized protein LOC113492475 [Trichoplusia ni]XP_026725736.1 uncharacterized protein LOC113492475 [Trichoplusia ni]
MMNVPSTSSTDSVMKRHKSMEWWYFGPVLLAIVMFLLMGTIFERRIESLWRRIIERRQAQLSQLSQQSDHQELPLAEGTTNSLHTVKTPSQRTLASGKTGSTSGDNNLQPIETRT